MTTSFSSAAATDHRAESLDTHDDLPLISVIVPVFEQWHLIPELLACLERQSLPADLFETIIVNNGGPSSERFAAEDTRIRALDCAIPGSYAARNVGAREAKGRWLAFTDSDCLPSRDWLERLLDVARKSPPNTIIAGGIQMRARTATPNPFEVYDLIKGIPQRRYVRHGYGATANLLVPAEVFRHVRGFDQRRLSGGDADLCRRATATYGTQIVYVPEASVTHPARTSWEELKVKTRRVKGGQLRSPDLRRRTLWLLRTLTPPVRAWWRFGKDTRFTTGQRATAIWLQLRLWLVELLEIVRLAFGAPAERR